MTFPVPEKGDWVSFVDDSKLEYRVKFTHVDVVVCDAWAERGDLRGDVLVAMPLDAVRRIRR